MKGTPPPAVRVLAATTEILQTSAAVPTVMFELAEKRDGSSASPTATIRSLRDGSSSALRLVRELHQPGELQRIVEEAFED